eukprot:CAMPEP_0170593292 /NCGR_PEP_ID=MMETSP0224-20130122/13370_1 /TAXON_ID=285029 /ORGANISM="Togula jolla, Strain CCCM 725" /LENGTH=943 /DNA_ID=CAMNT_0010917235 /DNA_START=157 /DNA_END=2985 /DNA_ORIENTATION=+
MVQQHLWLIEFRQSLGASAAVATEATPSSAQTSALSTATPPPPPPPPPRQRLSPRKANPTKRATHDAPKGVSQSSKGILFEEHWEEEAIAEGLADGSLVCGKLHVPSFHTDTAYVIPDEAGDGDADATWIPVTGFVARNRAFHGDAVVARLLWSPWRPDSTATNALDQGNQDVGSDRGDVKEEPLSSSETVSQVPTSQIPPPPPPLPPPPRAPTRAAEVSCSSPAPSEEKTTGLSSDSAEEKPSVKSARCRVVAVQERRGARGEIVASLRPPTRNPGSGGEARVSELRVQPRDRRLPAFSLQEIEGHTENCSREALLHSLAQSSVDLLCVVRFLDWPRESPFPRAQLLDVLGSQGDLEAESHALLSFYGLEWRPFPAQVEEALKSSFPDGSAAVQAELSAGRSDLRHLRCVTIDPPNARDLDDAVSISPGRAGGEVRIGVHIADVTHFVRPGSLTDLEARRRATTVYLVGKVYPMLPRWLSENLCSLLPDGDRLAFSVFFTLNSEGHLVTSDAPVFCRSVIRTYTRLDYRTVDGALSQDIGTACTEVPKDILEDLHSLASITAARRQMRLACGAVAVPRTQVEFDLDEDGRVEGLTQESGSSVSHHLIEELMVLANHLVATEMVQAVGTLTSSGGQEDALPQPLLRRHQETEAKVRKRILDLLPRELKLAAPAEGDLSELLAWCQQRQHAAAHEAVVSEALMAFKEAEYVVADLTEEELAARAQHWALALPSYMHFTSPIRRYADVLVHRRLAYILASREGTAAAPDPEGQSDSDSFLLDLKKAVRNCNAKKRRAQDAQLDAMQFALAEHVHRSGGLTIEDAVITRIVLPGQDAKESADSNQPKRRKGQRKALKEALEIYVPLAKCVRSVSLESLNLELVPPSTGEAHAEASKSTAEVDKRSIRVRVRDSDSIRDLQTLIPISVRLVTSQEQDVEGRIPRSWT